MVQHKSFDFFIITQLYRGVNTKRYWTRKQIVCVDLSVHEHKKALLKGILEFLFHSDS